MAAVALKTLLIKKRTVNYTNGQKRQLQTSLPGPSLKMKAGDDNKLTVLLETLSKQEKPAAKLAKISVRIKKLTSGQ